MNSIRTFLFFFLLIFIFSCNQEKEGLPVRFEKQITTDGLQTFKIPPVLLKERSMICTDDFLITNSATKDTVFRVFDRETLKYLGGFGQQGDGPENYKPNASTIYSPYGNTIHFGTTKKHRLVTISKDKNNKLKHQIIEEIKTPGELVPFNSSFKLNDTTYAGEKSYSPGTEVSYFTTTDAIVGSFIPYLDLGEDLKGPAKSIRYQKRMRLSRDCSKIVMTYMTLPLLRIYDVKTEKIKNIFVQVDSQFEPTQKARMLADGRNINFNDLSIYYINLRTTEKYIYAQMLIQAYNETSGRFEMHFPSELHVFDLQGEPKLKITLEDWMFSYAVSHDDQNIYFWNADVENELYKLPIGSQL